MVRRNVNIAKHIQDEIKFEARQNLPNECGGYVIEDETGKQTLWSITNVHSKPSHNYQGSPQETILANNYVYSRDGGISRRIICEWHSHPTTEAVPSQVDAYQYRGNDLLLLVSVANYDQPELRLWNLDNEEVGITHG